MRAAVICVLALAFVAFAAASVRAADVEMVEAELVAPDHPALMEVQRKRVRVGDRGIDGIAKKIKSAVGNAKPKGGKGKAKSKVAPKNKSKPLTGKPPKFNGNTGIAGGIPGASKVPGQPGAKSKPEAKNKRRFGLGAKGGQKADKRNPYAKHKPTPKPKDNKKYPKPGDGPSKTIGGHGTGAFGGQAADHWDPNAQEEAVNKDAAKGGPIGGAYKTLFGHAMGEKKPPMPSGPLTGKPPQFRKP